MESTERKGGEEAISPKKQLGHNSVKKHIVSAKFGPRKTVRKGPLG